MALPAKYKTMCAEMEAVLVSFEKAKEWADLINYLQRLQKVFARYPQFSQVPHKATVAKRLAQCLNPSLPSGVHLKTLETYSLILGRIGGDGLAHDLALWSSGLFPLFHYANTQTRPAVLELFETHFLPLGAALHACLQGLVLSILPGVEDKGSEFYTRTLALLDQCRKATSEAAFFHALWSSLLASPHTRLPTLNYIVLRFPKKIAKEAIDYYVPQSPLVVSALTHALTDSNILVQRSSLDVLLTHLNVDKEVITDQHMWTDIVSACLQILLRREYSLNRRVHMLLFGEGLKSARNAPVEHFRAHFKACVERCIEDAFAKDEADAADAAKPFRICRHLLEKPELAEELAPTVVIPALVRLKAWCESDGHRSRHGDNDEGRPGLGDVVRSASPLFDVLAPEVVWGTLCAHLARGIAGINEEQTAGVAECMDAVDTVSFAIEFLHPSPQAFSQGPALELLEVLSSGLVPPKAGCHSLMEPLQAARLRLVSLLVVRYGVLDGQRDANPPGRVVIGVDRESVELCAGKIGAFQIALVESQASTCLIAHASMLLVLLLTGRQLMASGDGAHAAFVGGEGASAPAAHDSGPAHPQSLAVAYEEKVGPSGAGLVALEVASSIPPMLDAHPSGDSGHALGFGSGTDMAWFWSEPPEEEDKELPAFVATTLSLCQSSEFDRAVVGCHVFLALATLGRGVDGWAVGAHMGFGPGPTAASVHRMLLRDTTSLEVIASRLWALLGEDPPDHLLSPFSDAAFSDGEGVGNAPPRHGGDEDDDEPPARHSRLSSHSDGDAPPHPGSVVDWHQTVAWLFCCTNALNPAVCSTVAAHALVGRRFEGVPTVKGVGKGSDGGGGEWVEAEEFAKFASLWALSGSLCRAPSDDFLQPCVFAMLDALNRRDQVGVVARAWLQSSLGDVHRILDPVLLSLATFCLDLVKWPSLAELKGDNAAMPAMTVDVSFLRTVADVADVSLATYLVQSVQAVLGACDVRALAFLANQSVSSGFVRQQPRLQELGSLDASVEALPTASYLDVIVTCALQIARCHPLPSAKCPGSLQEASSSAAGLVCHILSTLQQHDVPAAHRYAAPVLGPVLRNLAASVCLREVALQCESLHALLAVLRCISSPKAPAGSSGNLLSEVNEVMLPATLVGIKQSVALSPSLLHEWVAVCVACLPHMHNALPHIVLAITSTLCEMLGERGAHAEAPNNPRRSRVHDPNTPSAAAPLPMRHALVVVDGLLAVMDFCLSSANADSLPGIEHVVAPAVRESGVVADTIAAPMRAMAHVAKYMFTQEESQRAALTPLQEAQRVFYSQLPYIVQALSRAYARLVDEQDEALNAEPGRPVARSFLRLARGEAAFVVNRLFDPAYMLGDRISSPEGLESKVRRLLEPLVGSSPSHVVAALLFAWDGFPKHARDRYFDPALPRRDSPLVLMVMTNSLKNATPCTVVQAIESRLAAMSLVDRKSRPKEGSDRIVMDKCNAAHFLEAYIRTHPSPPALEEAWPQLQNLVKSEVTAWSVATPAVSHHYPLLLLRGLRRYMLATGAANDKRIKKEQQELVLHVVSTVTTPLQARRQPLLSPMALPRSNSESSPGERGKDDNGLGTNARFGDVPGLDSGIPLLDTIHTLTRCLPALLDTVWNEDREKAVGVVMCAVPTVVAVLRSYSNEEQMQACAGFLASMAQHSHTIKAWKKELWDLFHDFPFFNLSRKPLMLLREPIQLLLSMEKTAFGDLLTGKGAVQSGFIFQSRESEDVLRGRLLRRISYALFSGEKDEHVEHLPMILEKLSESMKLFTTTFVHSQVLFCMRVLLARVSVDYLASFWPLALSQILTVLSDFEAQQSDLVLVLSALQFLDFAMVLVPEELVLYRWMFFVDEAQRPPGVAGGTFTALLQRAGIAGDSVGDQEGGDGDAQPCPFVPPSRFAKVSSRELLPELVHDVVRNHKLQVHRPTQAQVDEVLVDGFFSPESAAEGDRAEVPRVNVVAHE